MEIPFRPAPVDVLARWIFGPLDDPGRPVLGLPRSALAVPGPRLAGSFQGRPLAAPLGLAAGPHTQLAQNIVAGWLAGARFIELKTVQVLDRIEVARPCIDAADETYNCEWSQELGLDQSFDEYLKAWVLIHALAAKLGLAGPGAVFTTSVGYDLAGVRSDAVQRFLARMRDPGGALADAQRAVARVCPEAADIAIPAPISTVITLSTMHGCPPAEIERIARFLLEEQGVDTWVKLNPTLLGPARVRGILNDRMGYAIDVPDAAFEHDPRFPDAIAMIASLARTAKGAGRSFGVKLSNTLEVTNHRRVFPAAEKAMYLSGRALHALTLTLAHEVTLALDGAVPISFCGGADAESFPRLVADGLGPVTVCSDLLKPGGYARLGQYLANLEAALDRAGAASVDELPARFAGGARENLRRHAAEVVEERRLRARERPLATKGRRPLGAFDCIAAPCQEACPAHQPVPAYLAAEARGEHSAALATILATNPLPAVTGSICDQPCVDACVRNHYEAPIRIREIKRVAAEHGAAPAMAPGAPNGVRVAVVGGGPAGLAAARDLRLAGFDVTLFEARRALGGVVGGVVPAYRLPRATADLDIDRLASLGVDVVTGARIGRDRSVEDLFREGYRYVLAAVGAQLGRRLGIPGEGAKGVVDALALLAAVREGAPPELGRRVLVIGAGNSAMDAARSARRLVPGGEVTVVYRRTRAEMPAHVDEVEACDAEGIAVRDRLAPVRVIEEGGRVVGLECQRMRLGEPDASGRPRPVPIEGAFEVLPADSVIVAISQEPELGFLGDLVPAHRRDGTLVVNEATQETSVEGLFAGGDVVRGPASIIAAVADGRRAAAEMARRCGVTLPEAPRVARTETAEELLAKRSRIAPRAVVPEARPAGALGSDRGRTRDDARRGRGRGGAVPRVRRAVLAVRDGVPEPRDAGVRGGAGRGRAAGARGARGEAGARGVEAGGGRAGGADRERRRLLQRVRQLHTVLPDGGRAVPRQAAGAPHARRFRGGRGRRIPVHARGRRAAARRAARRRGARDHGARRGGGVRGRWDRGAVPGGGMAVRGGAEDGGAGGGRRGRHGGVRGDGAAARGGGGGADVKRGGRWRERARRDAVLDTVT